MATLMVVSPVVSFGGRCAWGGPLFGADPARLWRSCLGRAAVGGGRTLLFSVVGALAERQLFRLAVLRRNDNKTL